MASVVWAERFRARIASEVHRAQDLRIGPRQAEQSLGQDRGPSFGRRVRGILVCPQVGVGVADVDHEGDDGDDDEYQRQRKQDDDLSALAVSGSSVHQLRLLLAFPGIGAAHLRPVMASDNCRSCTSTSTGTVDVDATRMGPRICAITGVIARKSYLAATVIRQFNFIGEQPAPCETVIPTEFRGRAAGRQPKADRPTCPHLADIGWDLIDDRYACAIACRLGHGVVGKDRTTDIDQPKQCQKEDRQHERNLDEALTPRSIAFADDEAHGCAGPTLTVNVEVAPIGMELPVTFDMMGVRKPKLQETLTLTWSPRSRAVALVSFGVSANSGDPALVIGHTAFSDSFLVSCW